MPELSIVDLAGRFPDFRVAFVFAEPLAIRPARSRELMREIAAAGAAYKGFGVKRTSYRSSAERLIKRVLAGQPLPEINALVDLYNMVSLESGLCLGCDDLDKTAGDLVFRFAKADDSF